MWPEESPAPFFEYSPPWRGPESGEDEEALLDFDLEALPELGPEVDHFLQELAGSSEEEDRMRSSPEPTSGSRLLPLGKECPRAEREDEGAHHLY